MQENKVRSNFNVSPDLDRALESNLFLVEELKEESKGTMLEESKQVILQQSKTPEGKHRQNLDNGFQSFLKLDLDKHSLLKNCPKMTALQNKQQSLILSHRNHDKGRFEYFKNMTNQHSKERKNTFPVMKLSEMLKEKSVESRSNFFSSFHYVSNYSFNKKQEIKQLKSYHVKAEKIALLFNNE